MLLRVGNRKKWTLKLRPGGSNTSSCRLPLSKHVGTLVPSNNKIGIGFCSDYLLAPKDLCKCSPISVKLKPGLHIIVRIVPVVSKNVQTIETIICKRYPDNRKRPGRFKIYMIVPIVRIELNSIQAIEVVSVVRVFCDRLGSVSIWLSRSSEYDWNDPNDPDDPDDRMETRLNWPRVSITDSSISL